MTVYYEEEGPQFTLDGENYAKDVLDKTLDLLGCPYECQLSLLLTTDEEIRNINRQYRSIDQATDVLSFPALSYDIPGDFSWAEEAEDAFDPDTGELVLGDIVISKDRVYAQSDNFGHTREREYAFLLVHSVLHLIGYDHMEEKERLLMEEKQRSIMDALGITRD